MNRHSGIVIAASIVIGASVGYSAFNAATLEELEFKWNDRGSFDYLTMLNGGVIEVCNSSWVPLRFTGLTAEMFYQGEEVGRFGVRGATVQPNSAIELPGEGEMTSFAGQIISMYLDTEISGTEIARMDSDAMRVVTSVDAVFWGIIPYSVTDTYTGEEFFKIMNGQSSEYGC